MPSVDLSDIRGTVELLQNVKRQQSHLKEVEAAAKAAIVEKLGNADEGLLDGQPVVRRTPIKSNKLDQKLLGQLYPDILAECKTITESTRFDVL